VTVIIIFWVWYKTTLLFILCNGSAITRLCERLAKVGKHSDVSSLCYCLHDLRNFLNDVFNSLLSNSLQPTHCITIASLSVHCPYVRFMAETTKRLRIYSSLAFYANLKQCDILIKSLTLCAKFEIMRIPHPKKISATILYVFRN
jgi:hypothetical protein